MKKKSLMVLICLILLFSTIGMLTACKKEPTKQQMKIVYLGDSIAEAILGPAPLSEREDYGYYGLLGQTNNYIFINRAVSGHQTKNMIDFLTVKPGEGEDPEKIILKTDDDAYLTSTHLKTANIIHISILGNDLLQAGDMFDTIILGAATGDNSYVDGILKGSYEKFSKIVKILRMYNPTATIFFQNVYNPVYPNSELLKAEVRDELAKLNVSESQYRELGYGILSKLNAVIDKYFTEYKPQNMYLIDTYSEFKRIDDEDATRGARLIFTDGVHPSNEGHAVIYDLNQAKFEELGLSDKNVALNNYKNIRIRQLNTLYKTTTVDIVATTNQISAATSGKEITKIYFAAIYGVLPVYC
ncbi:MAG: SGNH/GDSL hydrolase family protein [Clostridia bacterium]